MMDIDPTLLASISFGISILLMFWGIAWVVRSQNIELDTRIGPDFGLDDEIEPGRLSASARARRFNRLVSKSTSLTIAVELARAGLRLTPGEYVVGQIVTTVLGIALGYLIFRGNPFLAAVGGALGLYFPRWFVRYRQRKRLNTFNDRLPDALVLLANSLRSGYSFRQAMETVANEIGEPMAAEFGRMTREIGLGIGEQDAFANLLHRVPSEDFKMVITAIEIQNQVGGNLAEVLDTIAATIRERVRIIGEIRTITAQQRLSANVLSALPIILGLIIYALSPNYVSLLWQHPVGWILIGVGTCLTVMGYFLIRRIAAIEV